MDKMENKQVKVVQNEAELDCYSADKKEQDELDALLAEEEKKLEK